MIHTINLVNNYYNTEIRKMSRIQAYSHPRQVYLYCMVTASRYPLIKLAKSVNLKNHATVLHAVKTIKNQLTYNKELQKDIEYLLPIVKTYEVDRLKNYQIAQSEYDSTIFWLERKGFNINIEDPNWKQEKVFQDLKIEDMVSLLLMFKTELV